MFYTPLTGSDKISKVDTPLTRGIKDDTPLTWGIKFDTPLTGAPTAIKLPIFLFDEIITTVQYSVSDNVL